MKCKLVGTYRNKFTNDVGQEVPYGRIYCLMPFRETEMGEHCGVKVCEHKLDYDSVGDLPTDFEKQKSYNIDIEFDEKGRILGVELL